METSLTSRASQESCQRAGNMTKHGICVLRLISKINFCLWPPSQLLRPGKYIHSRRPDSFLFLLHRRSRGKGEETGFNEHSVLTMRT